MKPVIYLLSFLFLTISCSKDNSYTISGSFTGEQSEEWIYMVKILGSYEDRDSARIENGKFKFEGTIDDDVPELYGLHYSIDKYIGVAQFFLEPGNLDATIDLENWDLNSRVTGGKTNGEFNEIEDSRIEKFMQSMWKLTDKMQTAGQEEAAVIGDSLQKLSLANSEFEIDYINNHFDSPIALYYFYMNQLSFSNEELGELLSKFDISLQSTLMYETMVADYENQMDIKDLSQVQEITEIMDSEMMTVVDGPDDLTEGIQLLQANFNDKSILETLVEQNPDKVLYIDIWGTWCGSCKKEFPYSKKLYEEIDSNQIKMIFLCIQSEKEEWEQMVKSEGLKGQHYLVDNDNLKKFEEENELNISGIPRYIIVGKDGKIREKNAPRPSSDETKELLTQLADF